jgi:hypothetical protein
MDANGREWKVFFLTAKYAKEVPKFGLTPVPNHPARRAGTSSRYSH